MKKPRYSMSRFFYAFLDIFKLNKLYLAITQQNLYNYEKVQIDFGLSCINSGF